MHDTAPIGNTQDRAPLSTPGHAPFAARRERVLERLGQRALMILPAAPVLRAGRDTVLRYRPDSDLYYLTGYTEPGAVMVLAPGAEAPFTLFVRPRDAAAEQWTGRRGGPEAALEHYDADAAFPMTEFVEKIRPLLADVDTVYAPFDGGKDALGGLLITALAEARQRRQRTGRGPRAIVDPGTILDEMRLIKDADELDRLRRAGRVTVEGFHEAVPQIRPDAGEWEVEAALESAFRRRGAAGPAFPSIVASGPNATVLHYIENRRTMRDGELLLIDAGASLDAYAGDVSRTFPVSGRFSPAQRELYEIAAKAHRHAIESISPGTTVGTVHETAVRTLTEGLLELGLLDGEIEAILEENEYHAFYPHQTSHWLGLDVHDVGDYAVDGESRKLQPGMVLTVEPGLYIPLDHETAPEELRGTGIRIEDDIAVTEDGRENLTPGLPTEPAEVETLMNELRTRDEARR